MAADTPPRRVKPRLRGLVHLYAFAITPLLAAALVVVADGTKAVTAAVIYGATLCALFGVSALYHRPQWAVRPRRWLRRLDHSAIFLFIAGGYTPFAALVFTEPLATIVLIAVWSGALAGVILSLVWIDAPKWVSAIVYLVLGWVAVATLPQMIDHAGVAATVLVGIGGALYTAGAVVYALGRPDPAPAVFGYHEVFHVLVVVAALVQYVAIAVWAIPAG